MNHQEQAVLIAKDFKLVIDSKQYHDSFHSLHQYINDVMAATESYNDMDAVEKIARTLLWPHVDFSLI